MKTFRLWVNDAWNYLIDADEVGKVVLLGDWSVAIEGVNIEGVNTDLDLTKLSEEFGEYFADSDESVIDSLKKFFRDKLGVEVSPEYTEYYGDTDSDRLIYDTENRNFYYMNKDGYVVEIYRFWDGGDWKTVELDECWTDTRIVADPDFVNLDEWDGSNWKIGGIGLHQRIYRIVELDGGKPSEPTFLLEKWSQWQGDQPKGEILSLDEVAEHLKELGRDVDEYLRALMSR